MNSQTKTVLFWVVLISVLVFSFVYGRGRQEAKRVAATAKEDARRANVEKTIRTISEKHGADSKWMYELVKGQDDLVRFSDVRTIELERLWVTEHPVLFTGSIKDIQGGTSGNDPIVTVTYIELNDKYSISTPLILRLGVKDKTKLVELERLAKDDDFNDFGSIAFVAKVERVESSTRPDGDGGQEDIRVGTGSLVDFLTMPEAQ